MSSPQTISIDSPADSGLGAAPAPFGRLSLRLKLALVLSVLGGLVGAYYYSQRGLEKTDNAQIDAEMVAVPTRTSGLVTKVFFEENQRVTQGQLLAELDRAPAQAKLAHAQASLEAALAALAAAEADAKVAETGARGSARFALASLRTANAGATTADSQVHEAETALEAAEAKFAQARSEAERATELFGKGAMSASLHEEALTTVRLASANREAARARLSALKNAAAQAETLIAQASAKVEQTSDVSSVLEQAKARANAARAQVESARATLELASLELSYTRIVAPRDGVLSKKNIAVGQNAVTGQPIAQLVTNDRWVTANFKETQIARMQAGQPVEVKVDAYPGQTLHGTVESFSGATGSRFSLLPPDNASGNYTKVVQRVPVRVRLDAQSQLTLRPGMSAEITVWTRS